LLSCDNIVRGGDILRGGATFSPPAPATANAASGSTATVAKLRAHEQDVLATTTRALQAVQAMQNAARNLAISGPSNLGLDPNHPGKQLPNVPNGLATGGLQIAPGAATNSALWQNAKLPVQTVAGGQTTVTVTQTAPKAILTWQTFNVGKNTTAHFDQRAGTQNGTNTWIALNRILDPSGRPSQILGSIKAEGQVYLINQNGIIFGGSSQVNVNTLFASTLNLPDASFNQGFLAYTASKYNSSAVFSSVMGNASPTAGNGLPAFSRFYQSADGTQGPSLNTTNAPKGADIVVQSGSSINTGTGGHVVLLGAHVTNDGTISTPDGQTMLAAGDSVYLYGNPTAQMRGLSVDVLIDPNTNNLKVNKKADPSAGLTTNNGLIAVGKGNATLDGANVVQNGAIDALTGVDNNGSIILTARYAPDTILQGTNASAGLGFYISPTISGSLVFGPQSLTRIMPDLSDPTTTLDAQGFNPSVIVAQGKTVLFEGTSFNNSSESMIGASGAQVVAPGGTVTITAPTRFGDLLVASDYTAAFGLTTPGSYGPIYATSAAAGAGERIFIDSGVNIDVSGTQDVSLPVSRNVVTVNLRANPLQRNGPLYGKNIVVDISVSGQRSDGSTWYGTPFADASGYIASIGRAVGERTAIGGTINMVSGGDVVAADGSTLNVSGGWINFQSGLVSTTRLLGTDGHLYDIANADPTLTYVGIPGTISINHPRWGVTETYDTPLVSTTDQRFQDGYLDGRSAGSIAITANRMVLDGTLLGDSVSGPRQRTVNANPDSSIPMGGSLALQAPPDTATSSQAGFRNAIQENLEFVNEHAVLSPAQALALSSGTISLADPKILRDKTLLLPVDFFSDGGFSSFTTESSAQVTFFGTTSVVRTVSPFADSITLPADVAINLGESSSATLNFNRDGTVARNVDGTLATISVNNQTSGNLVADAFGSVNLEGSIVAPAGNVAFAAGVPYSNSSVVLAKSGVRYDVDPSYLRDPPSISVGAIPGSSPVFRLRGLWTNEVTQPSDNSLQPTWINGGSFSLFAPGAITIAPAAVVDVTGGGVVRSNGKMAASDQGKGGTISLLADTNPLLAGNNKFLKVTKLQPVEFQGTYLAYGMGGNGTIALEAGAVAFENDPGTAIGGALIKTSFSGATPGIIVPSGFLSLGGFSSYTFSSATDTVVTDGTQLAPVQKVLTTGNIQALRNAPTGADIYSFTLPALLPEFERKPASITLTANSTVTVGNSSSIRTDSGGSIALKGTPLITPPTPTEVPTADAAYVNVFGTLDAPGGNITLDAGFLADSKTMPSATDAPGMIRLGPHSLIAATGATQITVDTFGHRIGGVLAGGSISIQNTLYFVAEPGSIIDVSGGNATLDLATGRQIGIRQQFGPSLVASNGGSISISALDGLFLNGALLGRAGDAGNPAGSVAAGGSLVIQAIGQPVQSLTDSFSAANEYVNGILVVSEDALLASRANSVPAVSGTSTLPGAGFISAATIEKGGFQNVALQAGRSFQFIGDVALTGLNNLELHAPFFSAAGTYSPPGKYSTGDQSSVTVSASHIWIDGAGDFSLSGSTQLLTNKTAFNVHATTLDINGFSSGAAEQDIIDPNFNPSIVLPQLPSFGSVNIVADRDLRFVPLQATNASITSAGSKVSFSSNNDVRLKVPISFQATQIYPLSGVSETIIDYYSPVAKTDPASIGFTRFSTSDAGTTPLSAGGSIAVFAPVISQGGVLKAPLGAIILGSNSSSSPSRSNLGNILPTTETLTLTPDSITSVSMDGDIVPWGRTTASGKLWIFNNLLAASSSVPPVASISLNGNRIRIESDPQTGSRATINGSGSGDLYAYEFVSGVGGSNDVLNQPGSGGGSGVYAVLPGVDQYSLLGSPATIPNGAANSSDSAPRYGQMVHLTGIGGLASGDYVLLPAHYALLAGGYRVQLVSSNVSAQAQNVVNPDGSFDALGYFESVTTPGTRADATHNPWQQFSVQNGAIIRQNSQFIESFANSFAFINPNTNAALAPLLPRDAAQVVISPVQELDLDGRGVFAHAPGTIGGRVDLNISAPVAIVGDGGADGTKGAGGTDYDPRTIVLRSSSINNLNAESILIGGTRRIATDPALTDSTQNQTYIVAATPSITVDNGVPLQAPEIILASTDIIDLKPAAVIRSSGAIQGQSTGDLNFVANFDFLPTGVVPKTGAPGSVLLVSSGAERDFHRFDAPLTPVSGNPGYGNLTIESGAQVAADGAVLIEGYQSAALQSGAIVQAPSIIAAGNLVSLGAVPDSAQPTLAFSGPTFQALSATHDLTLISSTSIDFWGLPEQTIDIGNANLAELVIDAGELRNRTDGGIVKVIAENITLQATSDYAPSANRLTGSISMSATGVGNTGGELILGPGNKSFSGFDNVTLFASSQIVAQGIDALQAPESMVTPVENPGSLQVSGSLTLVSPVLTAKPNSEQQIVVAKNFDFEGLPGSGPVRVSFQSLNSGISIQAADIRIASAVSLPSGVFSVEATKGDVAIVRGANVDVSGVAGQFFDQYRYVAAGEADLTADRGNVILEAGSSINVSGFGGGAGVAAGGDAGAIVVSAGSLNSSNPGTGIFVNGGQLLGAAAPGNRGGSFTLNTGSLGDPTGLNAELNAGGFSEFRNLRVRTGNVVIGGISTAHSFTVSADAGSIEVQGAINASGTRGGNILLAARGNVTLDPGSLLDAHANSAAVDAYGKPIDAENEAHVTIETVSGTLNLAGGTINVAIPGQDAVTGQNFGGDVHLRAPLIVNGSGDSLKVTSVGTIFGATSVNLEAFQQFAPTNISGGVATIDSSLVTSIQAAFAGFSGVTPAIPGLANLAPGTVHFRPGVEIDYSGDVNVAVQNDNMAKDVNGPGSAGWDFSIWRFNNEPGYLTIRSAGNLTVSNSMSDGFVGVSSYNLSANLANYASTQTGGPSWTFALVSGSDMTAADASQVQSSAALTGQGNFTLAADNFIRTGTGDITVASGGDITLQDELSTIYTAGVPTKPSNPLVDYNNPAFHPSAAFDPVNNATPNPISFPTAGGNITITAQGNITAVQTPQLITDWLWRQGGLNPVDLTNPAFPKPAFYTPLAWGPIFGLKAPVWSRGGAGGGTLRTVVGNYSFAQGVGALAGGDITINAGGTITDLSAVIPSNGYQTAASNGGYPTNPGSIIMQGGGDLSVRAGGNIDVGPNDLDLSGNQDGGGGGSVFYVARGIGDIATMRRGAAPGTVTAEIAMDDAMVTVRSGSDLKIAPFDPLVDAQVFANQNGFTTRVLNGASTAPPVLRSYEFGYTSRTDLDGISLAGDVLPAFQPFNPGSPATGGTSMPDYKALHHDWGLVNSSGISQSEENALPSVTGKYSSTKNVLDVQILPTNFEILTFGGGIFAPGSTQDVNLNSKFQNAGYTYLGFTPFGADFQFPGARGDATFFATGDIALLPALSDADPANYPTFFNPQSYSQPIRPISLRASVPNLLSGILATVPEARSPALVPSVSQVHSTALLHAGDNTPVRVYSTQGDVTNVSSGVVQVILFEIPKPLWIKAGRDVNLILNSASIYGNSPATATTSPQWVQNLAPGDISVIEAGRDIDLNIRVDGPGTLYVQAGRNLFPSSQILSEGNGDYLALPQQGASLTVVAGVGGIGTDFYPNYSGFIQSYFDPPNIVNVNYLQPVESELNLNADQALSYLENLPAELQANYVLPAYFAELKASGRDYNNPAASDFGSYRRGFAALNLLFPSSSYSGSIDFSGTTGQTGNFVSGQISTVRGGNIQLLAPGGPITVGQPNGIAPLDSGVTTARGGSISTYSAGSVEVNQSRLATLGGGSILIWAGNTDPAKVPNPPLDKIANIDAGKGSKTELVAPPQAFLIDPATGTIGLDPAAVATGNGIATLPAVKGAPPSDIDLIAPDGTVNASDAGIRVSGNFSVAALHVVTNGNISVAGQSVGVPTVVAPNIGGLTAASNTAGASSSTATEVAKQAAAGAAQQQEAPSLITVEVLGYGGG
jgi:filamentous hemagglutinin family protein